VRQPFSLECATVVGRELRGESSLYITAYAPDVGLARMMKKISAKKTGALPDLFDDISAEGEADSPASLKFMRGFSLIKGRGDIALDYRAFEQASLVALTVAKNGAHIEDCARLSSRLRAALDAMAQKSPPEVVRLKFMYLLARDEGYPVREDFLAKLPAAKRGLFMDIIKTPSADAVGLRARAEELLEVFLDWTYANTDIIG